MCSSGGALLILHEAAMIIYTQTSWLSVQTLRICSSGTEVLLKSRRNNYEKNKGRYRLVRNTRNKCWGKVRSFASGLSTVFLLNCKKRYAGLILHQCLYMLVFMLFFFYLVFYSLSLTFWLILLTTFFKEAIIATAARFQGVKVQQNVEIVP